MPGLHERHAREQGYKTNRRLLKSGWFSGASEWLVLGASQHLIANTGLNDPYGITIESSGNILVTDGHLGFTAGRVVRIDKATGNTSTLSTGGNLVSPDDIAVGSNGYIYIADSAGNNGGIIALDPNTYNQSFIEPRGAHDAVHGIAVDGTGQIFFDDDDPSEIWAISPGDAARLVAHGGSLTTGCRHIALDLNGNVIVSDFMGNINNTELLRINPLNGLQETITTWNGNENRIWGIDVMPTPEPASLSLLALGGLALIRRKRQ